nr:OB-fold nucleic acid binding domain-containing protein [Candidatus Microthrix sp.]
MTNSGVDVRSAVVPRCGRLARRHKARPTGWRASSPVPRRRACRAWHSGRRPRPTCWATGVSADGHPTRFVRHRLDALGVCTTDGLFSLPDGAKVKVGGIVTHRQRPQTAGGTIFFNLEDETGLVNIVCSPGCWVRYRNLARDAPALIVSGRLERTVDDVVAVAAERFDPLPVPTGTNPGGRYSGHYRRAGSRFGRRPNRPTFP